MAKSIASLHRFALQGVQPTEHQLGAGAYGRVFEVEYAGTTCAAKEIHSIFFRRSMAGQDTELDSDQMKRKFLQECRICTTLRHPNIVQFIGMYWRQNDDGNGSPVPVMVMEKMQCSLRSFVERFERDKIQMFTKLSILHDVSMGLCYLHTRQPPVVHCDLTPNNIVLGSHLEAKITDLGSHLEANITDLGVAKVMRDIDSGCCMTTAPGTPYFMPPEALDDNAAYGPSLDVFSYGAVVLYVDTQEWPEPRAREKLNPETGRRELVSEVERRQEYLDKMGDSEIGTKMRLLVISCLNNDPTARPVITEISRIVKELKEHQDVSANPSNIMTQQLIQADPLKVIILIV